MRPLTLLVLLLFLAACAKQVTVAPQQYSDTIPLNASNGAAPHPTNPLAGLMLQEEDVQGTLLSETQVQHQLDANLSAQEAINGLDWRYVREFQQGNGYAREETEHYVSASDARKVFASKIDLINKTAAQTIPASTVGDESVAFVMNKDQHGMFFVSGEYLVLVQVSSLSDSQLQDYAGKALARLSPAKA